MKRVVFSFVFFLAAISEAVSVKTVLDLSYGKGGPEHHLDLYLPKGVEKPPLFVFVHGGAWISGDKSEYPLLGKAIASGGVAVAVINYRLAASPNLKHPMQVEDLVAALKYLGVNDEILGFDGTRIFAGGHSAGAHMIAFLASDPALKARLPKEKQVRGYVGLSGVYDLPKLLVRFPGYKDWFLDKVFGNDQTTWPAASPTRRSFEKQRWLLIHSPNDELIDLAQSDELAATLRKQNIAVELVTPKGLDHSQTVRELTNAESVETKAILGFISGKPR